MKPKLSYTIWFTQRTGSTLLCRALEETKLAGIPHEWLYRWIYEQPTMEAADLQMHLWKHGSTSNGVFGLKHSFHESHFTSLIEMFRRFPGCPAEERNRVRIWEAALPHHKHIFMTRRNKVRLAVSWWKAIQTQEWHRLPGEHPKSVDHRDAYSFESILHLFNQCSMREAGIQEFFVEGNIVPLTLVYEDFIQDYEKTLKEVLAFLELETAGIRIPRPALAPTADEISEQWTQRFREELQVGWPNRGW